MDMKLKITDEAVASIQAKVPGATLILDYDDGVGPFSAVGVCSLNTSFNLVATSADKVSADFNTSLDSVLGPIRVKDYALDYFADQHPVLKLGADNVLALSNDSGLVDGAVELIKF